MTAFDAQACFGESGALARALPGYHSRRQQQEMADAIWDALQQDHALAVEAGTGVGKTLAYLMPVLAFGKKTLIATGTRHLQDQLFLRDLRLALTAMPHLQGLKICQLKGRANYLCRYRYELYATADLGRKEDAAARKLEHWVQHTVFGDLAELDRPEDDPLLPAISSTIDNCLGSKCPQYEDCFVVQARERAREADLVVANHHLFAADLVMREDSLGELLPKFDVLVFDEAHRLAEVLEQFWGSQLGTGIIAQLCRDVEETVRRTGEGTRLIAMQAQGVRQGLKEVTAQVHEELGQPVGGQTTQALPPEGFAAWVRPLGDALGKLLQALEAGAGDEKEHPAFENLADRCRKVMENLEGWPTEAAGFCEYLSLTRRGFTMHRIPIDISAMFAEARERYPQRWVYTSATLSISGSFDYFRQKLGLGDETRALQLDSPFDFRTQTLLYLPPGLPEPNAPEYPEAMLGAVLPLLECLGGRTFLLCTSLRAVEVADEWLQARLDVPLLKQGSQPRRQLLARFVEDPQAVLLGSIGFWEGVDIRGQALSCVIIDRIPFVPHTELLQRARERAVKESGGNPFAQLQLPRAALMLKQGVGRLIRSVADHGVVVIGDPRLRQRAYGQQLLDSLPDMPVSTELHEALAFLEARGER